MNLLGEILEVEVSQETMEGLKSVQRAEIWQSVQQGEPGWHGQARISGDAEGAGAER